MKYIIYDLSNRRPYSLEIFTTYEEANNILDRIIKTHSLSDYTSNYKNYKKILVIKEIS